MDLRLLREWIRNPLLLEGVVGHDLENLIAEVPAFESGQILSLQRMKINHSSRFLKAAASYTAMSDQGQWLFRAIERLHSDNQGDNPQSIRSGLGSKSMDSIVTMESAAELEGVHLQQTRLDWFSLLGQVDWKSMETDELDLLYAEYTQTDYLEASSDLPISQSNQISEGDDQVGPKKISEEFRSEMDRIREMAAKSLDLDEVPVSESLAELYLEQGQKVIAVRIYRRLMLRFPSKTSYFQACIDQIESNPPRLSNN